MSDTKISHYLIPLALIIAAGLVTLAVWSQGGGEPRPSPTGTKVEAVGVGTLPALGKEGGTVTFVEFGDYQCPFCARFLAEVETRLRDQYIATGRMKMYWRDFPFLGPESREAALAARCASDQGKFWQYHDLLFLNQAGENQGAFSKENLIGLAVSIQLNQAEFKQCLESRKFEADLEADLAAGRDLGVQGTPTAFINGERVVGAQAYEVFEEIIKRYLR